MILFDKIRARISNQVTGVTVHYSNEGQQEINAITLKNERGKIKAVSVTEAITDLGILSEHIDSKIPVWLSVTGRNIINRKIDKDPGGQYLHYVLPNAKDTDFNISVTKNTNEAVFVSAIRTELIEELVTALHAQNIKIIGYSIGPASLQALISYELLDADEITIPGYQIEFKEKSLSKIFTHDKLEKDYYLIGNEKLAPAYLLPFTTALNYLLTKTGYDSVIPEIATDEESYTYGLLNRYMLPFSLGIIFTLLLINYFVFSYYNNQQQLLSSELSYKNSFFVKYDSLKSDILLKKKLIDQMRLTDNSRFGYYADRIAATIPGEITLNELTINKIKGKNRPGTIIEFDNQIYIAGRTKGSLALNLWIKELKKLTWIIDIEIENYENNDNKGVFKLKINY